MFQLRRGDVGQRGYVNRNFVGSSRTGGAADEHGNDHSSGHHVMLTGRSLTPTGFDGNRPKPTDYPSIASTITYLIPLFATACGVVVLNEGIAWNEPVGAFVVLTGVALSQGRLTRGTQKVTALRPRRAEAI